MEEATKREILRLRRQGATYQEIGNLVGYGLKSIQKVIGEIAPELAKMRLPRIPLDRRKRIAEDYYANCLSQKEVQAKYGIGAKAMNIIRLQFREQYGGKKKSAVKTNFTDEQIAEIRAEYEKHGSVRKLYEKWAITRSQLRRYGIIQANGNRAKSGQINAK